MNLPSRRAFRPDGNYYRTTRRQRLARSTGVQRRGMHPLAAAAIALATVFGLIAAWAIRAHHRGHAGVWAAVVGYIAAVMALLLIAFVVLVPLR